MKDKPFSFIPRERIYTDELRTIAWGTDASEYRLTPKIVVRANDEVEVSGILSEASRMRWPVTFRAAGTSLSGQAISNSVLVVAGKNWEKSRYNPKDCSITLQPGIV
jgi:D-lactate dehydrogenase